MKKIKVKRSEINTYQFFDVDDKLIYMLKRKPPKAMDDDTLAELYSSGAYRMGGFAGNENLQERFLLINKDGTSIAELINDAFSNRPEASFVLADESEGKVSFRRNLFSEELLCSYKDWKIELCDHNIQIHSDAGLVAKMIYKDTFLYDEMVLLVSQEEELEGVLCTAIAIDMVREAVD